MIESRQVTVAGVNAPVTVFKVINTQGYYTELCNYGASVLSIIVPDRQGKADDVLLGYPELSDHIQDGPYLGKTLGRFAGRIAKGKFTLNGQSYQLDINNGPNHLHGGAQGLSFRLWEYRQCSENSLRFTTTAQHLEDGYPGDCAISVEYTWTEDNTLIIDYHGTPTADSILNLSNHSYFNLAGTPTILGHQLRIHANEYLPLNADSIPEFPARQFPTVRWISEYSPHRYKNERSSSSTGYRSGIQSLLARRSRRTKRNDPCRRISLSGKGKIASNLLGLPGSCRLLWKLFRRPANG